MMWFSARKFCLLCLLAAGITASAGGQTSDTANGQAGPAANDTSEILKTVDQLVEQNRQLMEQINVLRQKLAAEAPPAVAMTAKPSPSPASAPSQTAVQKLAPPVKVNDIEDANNEDMDEGDTTGLTDKTGWGTYTPNLGFKVVNTEYGDMNISIYGYVRYLNQRLLDPTYTDAFGNVKTVQQRQDVQLNKVQIKFLGWIMSPKLRYFLYAWTNNAAQGLPAQVVLAGNLNYEFNKYITLSGGITSLPGTRSVEGNFPFWFSPDSRLIADEFFRPSYTTGIWARGQINDRLRYMVMDGNNLSTLGVSAAQLDHHFDTFSSMLVWFPTGTEFGIGYGDFEYHEKVATRLGAHFTRSTEDTQSQPNTQSIDNTQLRLSDGSIIFSPNLFGPGISINQAKYKMVDLDGGLKYHGYSLDGSYFMRWLGNFLGPGTAGLPGIYNNGFEVQASTMLVPRTLQLYAGGSKIFGQYGNPWDSRMGVNLYPFKNKVVRWHGEVLYLSRSPVGYTAVPFAVGAKGFVFLSNVELAF